MFPTDLGPAGACLRRDAVRLLGEHEVRTAIATGEFASPWPGVLVDPTTASEPVTVLAAGRLASGPGAVIAGPSAAFLHGCNAVEAAPVHVAVPYGSGRRTRPGLVVHNCRLLATESEIVDGLPVLLLERVVTDLLCDVRRPADALAVADQVLARLDAPERSAFRVRIHRRLRARPDPRGTRAGARLIDLATGRAESPAESRLLWRVVDLGFPVPVVNHWVRGIDGRPRYRVDLGWPELRIAVEHYGHAAHAERGALDAARVQDLERRGWIVVVVHAEDLTSTVRMEREIDEAFRRRGLHGAERRRGALRALRHRELRAG